MGEFHLPFTARAKRSSWRDSTTPRKRMEGWRKWGPLDKPIKTQSECIFSAQPFPKKLAWVVRCTLHYFSSNFTASLSGLCSASEFCLELKTRTPRNIAYASPILSSGLLPPQPHVPYIAFPLTLCRLPTGPIRELQRPSKLGQPPCPRPLLPSRGLSLPMTSLDSQPFH